MATEIVMPQMGESIAEGTITKWLKNVGDHVERDEPLFEISTDKVDAEIPSPAAGILTDIKFKEGDTVEINTVVAVLDGEGAQPSVDTAAAKDEETPAEAEPPQAEATKNRVVDELDDCLAAPVRVVTRRPGIGAADNHPLAHEEVVIDWIEAGWHLDHIARPGAGGAAIDRLVRVGGRDRLAQRALAVAVG